MPQELASNWVSKNQVLLLCPKSNFQEIQKLLNKQPSFPNSKRNINASFHPQVLNTIEALLYHLNNDKICNHYFIETLECLSASIILAWKLLPLSHELAKVLLQSNKKASNKIMIYNNYSMQFRPKTYWDFFGS